MFLIASKHNQKFKLEKVWVWDTQCEALNTLLLLTFLCVVL